MHLAMHVPEKCGFAARLQLQHLAMKGVSCEIEHAGWQWQWQCVCVCVCDATGETRKGCEAGVRVAAFNVGIDASVI